MAWSAPLVFLASWALFTLTLPAQFLRQETLGTGVTDVAQSRLDLAVRNTYALANADLDGDGDQDVILGFFYLFNPPLYVPNQATFTPVRGTGGIAVYANMTLPGNLTGNKNPA